MHLIISPLLFLIFWLHHPACSQLHSVSHSVLSNSLWPHGMDRQAPLSMGFSRQEHWGEQLFPSQGESCQPRDQNQISTLQADYLQFEPPGKPRHTACGILFPQPGIKPVSPALEAWSLNHWEVPRTFSLNTDNSYPACSADQHMPKHLVPVSIYLHIISR